MSPGQFTAIYVTLFGSCLVCGLLGIVIGLNLAKRYAVRNPTLPKWSADEPAPAPAFLSPAMAKGLSGGSMQIPAVVGPATAAKRPPGHAWGEISPEELSTCFLDSFLFRHFHSVMKRPDLSLRPELPLGLWERFCAANEWAKGMPIVFADMTGYTLNKHQLEDVASAFIERLDKHAAAEQVLGIRQRGDDGKQPV